MESSLRKRRLSSSKSKKKKREQSPSESDSSSSDSSHRKNRKKPKKKDKHTKYKKRSRHSSTSSSSSSSSSSSEEERRRRKKRKKKKKMKKKLKAEKRAKRKSIEKVTLLMSEQLKQDGKEVGPSIRVLKPMTKEEWEKQQSIVRKVYDPETGRHRLIKGDGEVIEDIVSKEKHKEINKTSTRGDGMFYMTQAGLNRF